MKELSIVIPAHNEEKNVRLLYQKLMDVFSRMETSYEIIYIDDGSTDNTFFELEALYEEDKNNVKVIKFRRNFGQTAALDAGFKAAKGKVIVSMDADLQNDPADIPKLLAKMKEGYDVVCGWRKNRKDPLLKHLISRGANFLRSIIINDKIHDSGCTLKAFKRECFTTLDLYGEIHRFIPALLELQGFKITEIVVNHKERIYGSSKYNSRRIMKGFLDILLVKFWMKYVTRPMHLFGELGLLMAFSGFIIGSYLSIRKLMDYNNYHLANRPLLLLAIILVIIGINFILSGCLADIIIKTYFSRRKSYNIEKELI